MSDANMILTLGKVIIAAAWADGEVTPEEVNSLKDLLFRLPGLTGREWANLEMYIESPVGAAERERLVTQLKEQISSSADKALAVQALDDVVAADGVISTEERQVVEQIKSQIQSATVGVIGALGRVIRGSMARRSEALSDAPNREAYFEDFIKNKVFYSLRLRMAEKSEEIDLPEADLRKLSLAGGLMARVAQVDKQVTEGEIEAMVHALQTGWGLGRQASAFVAEVAVSEVTPDMDYYRLTRQFFTTTTEDERARFLDVLFSVAAADGMASNAEIEEIRAIARALKLTHQQFIDAKLKVPKESREA